MSNFEIKYWFINPKCNFKVISLETPTEAMPLLQEIAGDIKGLRNKFYTLM